MANDELIKSFRKGESEVLELKKPTAQMERALKSACAFLNHRGGTIYFGVSDSDGKIVGQQVSDSTLKSISQKIRQRIKPEISPEIKVLEFEGKDVIEVKIIGAGNKPYYLDGIAYKRAGSENPIIAPDELERIILEKKRRCWDEQICEGATLADIDAEKVKWFLRKAKFERNFDIEEETPAKEALERLELSKNGRLTNASILLFAKKPQKFFLHAETRCGRFKGTEPVKPFIDMKVFGGNIFDQVERSVGFVLEHIPMKLYLAGKPEREEKYEYPPDAIREAIINAICHRDYQESSNVQVRIFDDRIEIWGCGRLPEPLTPEDLKKKHKSVLRNPLIAKCFFLIKFVEEWGTGTNDIVAMCLEWGLPEPLFEEVAGSLVVTFRKYNITEKALEELTERQRKIIKYLLKNKRATAAISSELLSVSEDTALRELSALIDMNFINKVGKGKNTYYTLK